eukprot:UN29318
MYVMEDYLAGDLSNTFLVADFVFTLIFLAELFIQCTAYGISKNLTQQQKEDLFELKLEIRRQKNRETNTVSPEEQEHRKSLNQEMETKLLAGGKYDVSPEGRKAKKLRKLQIDKMKNPNYIFKSWFSVYDFVIIILSLICTMFPRNEIAATVRAFRVFRLIPRIKQVRFVVDSLTRIVPAVANTIVFVFFFWFILAVLGMNLYANKMSYCDDDSDTYYSLRNRAECRDFGAQWRQKEFN